MKIVRKLRRKRRKLIRKFIKRPIKRAISQYCKDHPEFRRVWRNTLYKKRKLYYWWRGHGVTPDEKTVVFNSFNGKTYGCSPKAVYEYMISHEEFADWQFIWAFKNAKKHKFLEENPNTKVIRQTARIYERKLARAKYWVTNYRVPDHVWPKPGQVYVQCWHGTPLKRLGYDLQTSENAIDSIAEIREKYDTDAKKFNYILSPSGFASEKFSSAWNLKESGMEDKVMEIGYPRNDFLINYKPEDIRFIKENIGIPEDKKVILYAPTWRDNQHESGVGFTYDLNVDFERLREKLGEEYVILFRVHYLVASKFSFDDFEGFIYNVSNYDDINHLYLIADLLITDYSSVFFDYGILKKPMLFYMYDLDDYKDSIRGFYFGIDKLPGRIITKEEELPGAICDSIENFVYDEKYKEFNDTFSHLEDGQASARFVATVFKDVDKTE
jgi:CDP-glycerol glycerophosphotransferase